MTEIERKYLEFSKQIQALETPAGVLVSDTILCKDWHRLTTIAWKEINAYTSSLSSLELAVRFAITGLSIADVKKIKSANSLSLLSGMRLPDAFLCIYLVKHVDPVFKIIINPSLVQQLNSFLPTPDAINLIPRIPYNKKPELSFETIGIRSVGPKKVVSAEFGYHTTMLTIITLYSASRFIVESFAKDGQFDKDESFWLYFEIITNCFEYMITCHSVVGILHSLMSRFTDYHACHYLSIPWSIRFFSSFLLYIVIILRTIEPSMELFGHHRIAFYVYIVLMFFTHSLIFLYCLVMSARGFTVHRQVDKQLCRWFPFGKNRTSKYLESNLIATGEYYNNLYIDKARKKTTEIIFEDCFRANNDD